jgi:hypothetical protein
MNSTPSVGKKVTGIGGNLTPKKQELMVMPHYIVGSRIKTA